MAKKEKLVIAGTARASAGTATNSAKESAVLRTLRIDGSCNGQTLRTRVIKNKKLYNRNFKHKKSFADAGDFPILWASHGGSEMSVRKRPAASLALGDFPHSEASLVGSEMQAQRCLRFARLGGLSHFMDKSRRLGKAGM